MSSRLNDERQNELTPERMTYGKEQIKINGYEIIYEDEVELRFLFKNELVKFYPYSGWHTGKSITDGRGIKKLLSQIKK